MARKRKAVRLGRLRTTVRRTNMIYGLLLQAHEGLRSQVIALEQRVHELEGASGKKWNRRRGAYEP